MTEQTADHSQLPAILGGEPVFPAGPPGWPLDDPEVAEAVSAALHDRSWGSYHGGHCERLIERLAAYHQCEQAVLCASGTAAIELALRGLKVQAGDEVVLTAYDFKGNFQNVLTLGAIPVLIDVAPENWNFDPDLLAAAISPQTKAIIVSHLHGGVVPMPRVMHVAREHDLPVIEDACQMPGARLFGKAAGMWGDIGVLSFGGSKLLTAGRGGALLTDDADVVQRMRLYSHRGNEAYPLSELQAAVLLPQLERLDQRNSHRTVNAAGLCDRLSRCEGLAPFRNFSEDVEPGYYKFGIQYDPAPFEDLSRDQFSAAMRAEGIALDAGFRALHLIHSARRFRKVGELSHASEAEANVLTLHHPLLLKDGAALDRLVEAVEKIRRHAAAIRNSRSSAG